MHSVSVASSRSSSAMRSRIRAVHRAESFAQSERSGTRFLGSRASSCADLLERQPDLLGEHDERDAPDHRARVAPVAGVGPLGANQPLVFVETQGRRRRPAALAPPRRSSARRPWRQCAQSFRLTSSALEDRCWKGHGGTCMNASKRVAHRHGREPRTWRSHRPRPRGPAATTWSIGGRNPGPLQDVADRSVRSGSTRQAGRRRRDRRIRASPARRRRRASSAAWTCSSTTRRSSAASVRCCDVRRAALRAGLPGQRRRADRADSAGRAAAGRTPRPHREHHERRRARRVSRLGAVRREQGGARAADADAGHRTRATAACPPSSSIPATCERACTRRRFRSRTSPIVRCRR